MIVTDAYQPTPEGYPGGRSFGRTIQGRRIGAGVTLRKCAEHLGITMYAMSQIERGERPMTESERGRFDALTRKETTDE